MTGIEGHSFALMRIMGDFDLHKFCTSGFSAAIFRAERLLAARTADDG